MTDTLQQAAALRAAFDVIEESYEFMLAYAAQGRKHEMAEGAGESQIRQYLRRMLAALDECSTAVAGGIGGRDGAAFAERFRGDIAVARSVVSLLLAQPSISSEMVDNSNGLIALRAFLTDVFFVDQVVLPPR
ncbi:MAG: hypothetical protein KJZ85_04205 [Rhodobacteraceae bacterium]|nr:hypothetical protein [Paracoccaceae bacterium]